MKKALVTAALAAALILAPSSAWSDTVDGNADGLVCIKLTASGQVLERDNTVGTRSGCPRGFSTTTAVRKSVSCTGSFLECGPGSKFQAACEKAGGRIEGTNPDASGTPQTFTCHLP